MRFRINLFFTSKYSFSSGVGYAMRPILLIMWTAFQSFILRHNNNNNNYSFKEYVKRIGVNVGLEVIQKTALLGTAKILRKYCPCKKKEKRDLGLVATCCNLLPRTILSESTRNGHNNNDVRNPV